MSNHQPTPCCHRDWNRRFGLFVHPLLLLEVPRIDSHEVQMVGICSIHFANGSCWLSARPFAIWLSYHGGEPTLLEP